MILKDNETDIRSQLHLMWAEGTHSIKPIKKDIRIYLKNKNYSTKNIYIFFDTFQKIWRWHCNILNFKKGTKK